MEIVRQALGKVISVTGNSLKVVGKSLEVQGATYEALNPSLRSKKLHKIQPKLDALFVAPDATIVGKVSVGKFSSIWYGAILRADVSSIRIGNNVSIGDRTMIHCSGHPKEIPTVIGNNVVVEAGSILHACTLEDNSYVGEGSQIMDGAKVEKNAAVAPGSLVSIGKVIPSGQLWGGCPATFQRNLTASEIAAIDALADENAELAVFHREETNKTWKEQDQDDEEFDQTKFRHPDGYFPRESTLIGYSGPGSLLKTDYIEKY